jgi:hypothetical protein
MSSISLLTLRAVALSVVAAMLFGLGGVTYGQTSSTASDTRRESIAGRSLEPQSFFENVELKLQIPPGWSIAIPDYDSRSKAEFPPMTSSIALTGLDPRSGLVLTKRAYTLVLAYETGHASGISGGRFAEILRIPWLDDGEDGACTDKFQVRNQPVDRTLTFTNLILEQGDPTVLNECGFPDKLAGKQRGGRRKNSAVRNRWFAGFFGTATPGWFIESNNEYCADKAYFMVSAATDPNQLPFVDDPKLKKIIDEAIEIVASIRYKRCPPASEQSK